MEQDNFLFMLSTADFTLPDGSVQYYVAGSYNHLFSFALNCLYEVYDVYLYIKYYWHLSPMMYVTQSALQCSTRQL